MCRMRAEKRSLTKKNDMTPQRTNLPEFVQTSDGMIFVPARRAMYRMWVRDLLMETGVLHQITECKERKLHYRKVKVRTPRETTFHLYVESKEHSSLK